MTTIPLPMAGLQWRTGHPTPPDVVTPHWCPLDDTTLRVRMDGWGCPTCCAVWDFKGLHGRWLPVGSDVPVVRARWSAPERIGVVGFVGGAALAMVAGVLDDSLVLFAAATLFVAGLATVAAAWLAGVVERARLSATNEVLGTTADLGLSDDPRVAAAQLAARRAVSDGR